VDPADVCSLPSDVDGYDVADCPDAGSGLVAALCGVACAEGFHGSEVVSCPGGGRTAFQLSGCLPDVCTLPEGPLPLGLDVSACVDSSFDADDGIDASECEVLCKPGFVGQPFAACAPGGDTLWELSSDCHVDTFCGDAQDTRNCSAVGQPTRPFDAPCFLCDESDCCGIACAVPQAAPTGFDLESCYDLGSGTISPSFCLPRCARGYEGNATASCAFDGDTFTFAGCELQACVPRSSQPGVQVVDGVYDVSLCVDQSGDARVTVPECIMSCAEGYIGTPVAECYGNDFIFSGCEGSWDVRAIGFTGYVSLACTDADGCDEAFTAPVQMATYPFFHPSHRPWLGAGRVDSQPRVHTCTGTFNFGSACVA
jgi:hypothetical protein